MPITQHDDGATSIDASEFMLDVINSVVFGVVVESKGDGHCQARSAANILGKAPGEVCNDMARYLRKYGISLFSDMGDYHEIKARLLVKYDGLTDLTKAKSRLVNTADWAREEETQLLADTYQRDVVLLRVPSKYSEITSPGFPPFTLSEGIEIISHCAPGRECPSPHGFTNEQGGLVSELQTYLRTANGQHAIFMLYKHKVHYNAVVTDPSVLENAYGSAVDGTESFDGGLYSGVGVGGLGGSGNGSGSGSGNGNRNGNGNEDTTRPEDRNGNGDGNGSGNGNGNGNEDTTRPEDRNENGDENDSHSHTPSSTRLPVKRRHCTDHKLADAPGCNHFERHQSWRLCDAQNLCSPRCKTVSHYEDNATDLAVIRRAFDTKCDCKCTIGYGKQRHELIYLCSTINCRAESAPQKKVVTCKCTASCPALWKQPKMWRMQSAKSEWPGTQSSFLLTTASLTSSSLRIT